MNDSSPTAGSPKARLFGNSVWPDICLLGVALIWGINIPVMKTGLEQVDVFVFNGIRLTISATVLAVFACRERRRRVAPGCGVARKHVLAYAVLVSILYHLLFLLGIARTTAGNTALIIATVPMWTALLARVFLGESLQRLAWCGLFIAVTGTIVVALQKGDFTSGSEHLWGNLIILGAALVWATGTVYSRSLLENISPLQLSASAVAFALPVHLALAAGQLQSHLPALRSVDLWIIIFYSGILSSGLAFPMWNAGVQHAGAAHAAVIQNLVPLVAVVAAWVGRGETITAAQLFGGILILGGLITMRIARMIPQPSAPES